MKAFSRGAALLALLALAGCGGGGKGIVIQDGSGQPVQIGAERNASVGPGSPGWPESTGSARYH